MGIEAVLRQLVAIAGHAREADRQGRALLHCEDLRVTGFGGFFLIFTGSVAKSNGMPRMSAYSASSSGWPAGSQSRPAHTTGAAGARPITCSQSSWVPKARTPSMWVTRVGVPTLGEHRRQRRRSGSARPAAPPCRPCSSPRAGFRSPDRFG